ncbi:hypothetical protein EJ377_00605 [Chryseobacterium arthrosphaerae]|uniref:Leucine-rich repeat domain-containing protein n=1 Tax=Chryseobacterium arthrosphaerae TaxID=651561 RepID=A0A3S0Q6W1_9FLAO|nr:hypothetical protein EJ377_00605 [Chryseobacterium arthrosphaerae]
MSILKMLTSLPRCQRDGEISNTEAKNATLIMIDTNYGITNIDGIEAFTNLNMLFIRNNPLSSR